MEGHNFIPFLFFFTFISFPSLPTGFGQLLPVVDDYGGSTTSRVQNYIIHVEKPEDVEFVRFEDLQNWHESFLPNTTLDSGKPRLIYSYRNVISGFAARLTSEEVRAMEAVEGFVNAEPSQLLIPQTTYTPDYLGLKEWDGLWYPSKEGEGIIIGVVDTGILQTHPSFQDEGMPPPPEKWRGRCDFNGKPICNNKLIGARAFNSGASPLPSDGNGHGTSMASVAAGNFVYNANVLGNAMGTASGIAPRAHLAMYKVCFDLGCQEIDLLAGIDQAIDDGVDVLSMSLGIPLTRPFHRDKVMIGAFRAIENGIFCSAAAGNFGPTPSDIINDAPWVLSVGESSMGRRITATVKLGNGMELDGQSAYQPSTFDSNSSLSIVFPKDVTGRGCRNSSLNSLDLKDKIVLCYTEYDFNSTVMGEMVKAAGGAAMIVMNDNDEGLTTKADAHVLPASHVTNSDAEKIISYLQTTTNPNATILFRGTEFPIPSVIGVAAPSSRGPSLMNGGILKPDIIGPGVNILAAWPWEVGPNRTGSQTATFMFETGTSLATAHLSGIAALLKKLHPQWSPAAIKSAIMTTANTRSPNGQPIIDEYKNGFADFFAMGAGHVNPNKANDPGLIYDIHPNDYIPYLCGLGYTDKQVMKVIRRPIQCSGITPISAEELNYPSISLSQGLNTKTTINRTVTNVGDDNAVYSAKTIGPKGVTVIVSPTELSFSKLNQQESFSVEFITNGSILNSGEVTIGQLVWSSGKHVVKSPICITIT